METVRGTTPTITFKLPFQTDELRKFELYFGQLSLLFTKTDEDCSLDENLVSVQLSQAETLQFSDALDLKMQFRFVFTNGRVGASKPVYSSIVEIMKDGEIDVSD